MIRAIFAVAEISLSLSLSLSLFQSAELSLFFTLSSMCGSFGLDTLAPFQVIGVCRSLALHGTVTVKMAITTALGWNANLVWAGRIGTRLGRPVAVTALTFKLILLTDDSACHRSTGDLSQFDLVHALKASRGVTCVASRIAIVIAC